MAILEDYGLEEREVETSSPIPGIDEPKINGDISVDGESSGGGGVNVLSFSKGAGSGTGTQKFEGFGFRPSKIEVNAWYNGTGNVLQASYAVYNGSINGWLAYEGVYSNMGTRILAVYDGGNRTRANFSTFTSDGVEFDFINDSVSCKFNIKAYK